MPKQDFASLKGTLSQSPTVKKDDALNKTILYLLDRLVILQARVEALEK